MRARTAIASMVLCALPAFGAAADPAPPRFPAEVTTIDGAVLDVAALALSATVVVVTVKAAWCPVCRRQLERIHRQREQLAECGVSFVVLGPGPAEQLAEVRAQTSFPHPFVADDGLEIARSLGLELAEDQIVPAILMLEGDLTVGWMQRGRSAQFYGDPALVEKVRCWERIPI